MKNSCDFNQYQQNQINTASPEQILLMLYDGAIRFTREAIVGVEEDKPEMRRHGVSRAMAIVTEFSNTLNHEIGGEIAEDLHELYAFMIRELTSANMNNDVDKLQVVKTLLVDLRQTWGEAIDINRQEKAVAAAKAKVVTSETTTPQAAYVPFSVSS